MQAYATKTQKARNKSIMKEEQHDMYPEFSGIINLAGSGRSLNLPNSLRSRVHSQFGLNIDSLRVKESPQVAEMGEKAITQGNIISFAPGVFDPYTDSGQAMIGHELHHITEQAKGLSSNIKGSNIHYDPASESASDTAGREFASNRPPVFTPAVTPVAAASAPVQGNNGFTNFLSKLLKKRPQEQNKVPGDLPNPVEPVPVQPGPEQLPIDNNSEVGPVSIPIVGDQNDIDIEINSSSNKDQVQPESKSNSKPEPESKNEPYKDDSFDKELYDVEKHFIPSPDSGIFKKMAFEKSMDTNTLTGLNKDYNWLKKRRKENLYRGMKNLGKDNTAFKDFYAEGGKYADLTGKVDKGNGIGKDIEMTYHSNVINTDYTKIKENRIFRERTALFRPKLAFFWLKNILSGTKDRGELFNDKIKRSVILDSMQSKDNVQKSGLSRNALKVIYENVHKELKEEKYQNFGNFGTRLDADASWLPDPGNDQKKKKEQEDIANEMKGMATMDSGHSWIETNSTDKDGNERVRFTMGFVPSGGSNRNAFAEVGGTVINPDFYDSKQGNFQKSKTISKPQYKRALEFAKGFISNYSLSGIGAANCTSFATDLAKTAGLNVSSSKFTLKGRTHSPDIAAKKLNTVPESQYTQMQGGYKEFEIPKEADIDDSKASYLLLTACKASDKFSEIFNKLSGAQAVAGEIILKDKLQKEFQKLFELNKVYMLKALNRFEKSGTLPDDSDMLTVFVNMVMDKSKSSLSGSIDFKKVFADERDDKLGDFMYEGAYKMKYQRSPRATPTAEGLLPFFEANKNSLQSELIAAGILSEKWSDSAHTDKVARAFAIAFESQLLTSYELNKLYEKEMGAATMTVPNLIRRFKFMNSKDSVASEMESILSKYDKGDDEVSKTYDDMYFPNKNTG